MRLTATEPTQEVMVREMEGLWVRAPDAAALLREEWSEEMEVLEVLGDAGRKKVAGGTPLQGGGVAPQVVTGGGSGGRPLR